jgi:outer membrane protein TolC
MSRKTISLAALACSAAATAAHAGADGPAANADDTGQPIALTDVLTAAVRRSPNLALVRTEHKEAIQRIAAADLIDEWHLIFRADGQDAATPAQLAPPGSPLDTRVFAGEVGLAKSLSTGGDVAVAVAASDVAYLYPATTAAPTQVTTPYTVALGGQIATLRVTASQPLARGAGENAARADQKTQRLAGRSMSAQADDEASEMVREIVMSYWELAYADEALAVDREGAALAAKQVAITADVVRAGLAPPSANQIAQLQVALRREAILRDATTRDDQSLALRRIAGLDLVDVPLAAADDSDTDAPVPNERLADDVAAKARVHGPGIVAKRLEQKSADVQSAAADNATLPRVDLTLTAELSGVADQIGDAFQRIGQSQMYSVTGGMVVQFDLGGAAHHAATASHLHRAKVDAERADLERQLEAAGLSAARMLSRARERAVLSRTAIDVAREALRSEIVAFQAGRSTTYSVFQRQDELSQAKLRLARARIDALEADALIDYLTGGLLDRYGVSVVAKDEG